MGFSEWDACLAAGLDLWKWETGFYPKHFKVRVMAFIGLQREISAHTEDQKAIDMEREQRKKGRR
jgi:hypothetical protein